MSMKGLTQFIADLRGARSHEQEQARINKELQNIRDKFAETNLNAYNKRKYVAKLIYIYVLGYTVEMGNTEALALIKMPNFPEKQVGYLALTLIYTANPETVDLALPNIFSDLASLDDINTSLALSFLSSLVTVYGKLPEEVYKLVISPTSTNYVRKKASLTLLHFYKLHPDCIEDHWIDRIVALLDSSCLGVSLCAASLIKAIANEDCFRCPNAFVAALNHIKVVFIDQKVSTDYMYYKVPCPWLCVRLMEILQLFPLGFAQNLPNQSDVLEIQLQTVLIQVANAIIDSIYAISTTNDAGQRLNANNMVFFEVVNVLEHHDLLKSQPDLTAKIFNTLTTFLQNKQATVRFLSLNALLSLHKFKQVKNLHKELLKLLRDRDISVRRKCVDLLFNIADESNVEHIAAELLDYLPLSDSLIRKDVITVLAAMLENHASQSKKWYFDSSLSLLMVGGSSVVAQVWQKLIRFVSEHEELQAYAATAAFDYIKQQNCSIQTIKVGAYILGEYGELVAHERGKTPEEQFLVLQDKLNGGDDAIPNILTTYIKFANLYPGLRPQIGDTFSQYLSSTDSELHQRAIEYTNMLKPENIQCLPLLWEKMPPSTDQPSASLMAGVAKHKVTLTRQNTGIKRQGRPVSQAPSGGLNGAGALRAPRPPLLTAASSTSLTKDTVLSTNWEHGFRHMLTHNQATLFQDALIQVGCNYEFSRVTGSVFLRLYNISDRVITGLSVTIHNPMDSNVLSLSTKTIPKTTLKPNESTELVVVCQAKQPFAISPLCRVQYIAGAFSEMNFRLPIVIERFMTPTVLDPADFVRRWEQIGPDGEFRKSFKNFSATKVRAIVDDDSAVIQSLGYGLVAVKGSIVLAAGILHTEEGGNFGCLLRLSADADRKNIHVVARSTKKVVAAVLTKNVSNAYLL